MPVNPNKVAMLAQQKQLLGVQFTPTSAGHAVTYPLDADSRANLSDVFMGANANLIPDGIRLTVLDGGTKARVLFTQDEVKALGVKAFNYVKATSEHADALLGGQAQWTDVWPSNT